MAWDGFDEVVAIADAGSFVRAAALLGISTSSISRIVARLEARLETRIFRRTTRRLELTDTGRAFVERCRDLVCERDELLAEVGGKGDPQGDLRITCSIAIGERFLAPIVRRFAEENPRLSVNLHLTNRILDLVAEGYDVGIRTGPITDSRLAQRLLTSRRVELCASPAYLERAGTPQSIDALQGHECLQGTRRSWHFLENGAPREFSPRGRWRCNSGSAVVDAALSDMGICQLPAFYVRDHIKAGRLDPILEQFRGEREPIWAVYPHRRQLLPKVRNFVAALQSSLHLAINA